MELRHSEPSCWGTGGDCLLQMWVAWGVLACPEEAGLRLFVLSSCKTRYCSLWVCGPDGIEIRARWERPYRILLSELHQEFGEAALLVGCTLDFPGEMEWAFHRQWSRNIEVCFTVELGRVERIWCQWNPLAAFSESCFEVASRFQQHACTWKMKTLDRAGVYEYELALASSVIFFGYPTAILPIHLLPQANLCERAVTAGEILVALLKMCFGWEREGFPCLQQRKMLQGHLPMYRN